MRQLVEGIRRQVASGAMTEAGIAALQELTRDNLPSLQNGSLCKLVSQPGRYLCYKDPEHGFVVMLMVWAPGQETPIHDHGTWGVEVLLTNSLKVTTYSECEVNPQPQGEMTLKPGDIMHNLPPDRDVHRVSNPTDELSMSLHIYGKEMSNNRQFVPGEGYKPCYLKTLSLDLPSEFRLDQLRVS